MRIRAYVLAGGKSSRMGRDKATLELAGSTLLARAVNLLRNVSGLRPATGEMIVTIAGARAVLDGADRSIVDRYPGCGPLGGFEAALDDLERSSDADWAFFIPVDMPLLRADLVERLLTTWKTVTNSNAAIRACLVEVDGRLQPLVSLVHRSVLKEVRVALETGRYKVAPLMQSVIAHCTSFAKDDSDQTVDPTDLYTAFAEKTLLDASEPSRDAQQAVQTADCPLQTFVQFTNVNTEADLLEVATLMKRSG